MRIISLRDLEKIRNEKLVEKDLDEKSLKKFRDSIKKRNEEQSEELGKQLYELIDSIKYERLDPDQAYNNAKKLILRGADVDYQNPGNGNFPLFTCAMRGYTKLAILLLQAGANVNLQNTYGTTALMKASRHEFADIVSVLLLMGADVNIQCSDGDTALFSAKQHNSNMAARILIEHQASLTHMNSNGKTLKDITGSIGCLEEYLDDDSKKMDEDDIYEKFEELMEESKRDLIRFGIDPNNLEVWLKDRNLSPKLNDGEVSNGSSDKQASIDEINESGPTRKHSMN